MNGRDEHKTYPKKNVDPKNKIKESAHGNIQIKEGWEE
jgi:hypothetical protein